MVDDRYRVGVQAGAAGRRAFDCCFTWRTFDPKIIQQLYETYGIYAVRDQLSQRAEVSPRLRLPALVVADIEPPLLAPSTTGMRMIRRRVAVRALEQPIVVGPPLMPTRATSGGPHQPEEHQELDGRDDVGTNIREILRRHVQPCAPTTATRHPARPAVGHSLNRRLPPQQQLQQPLDNRNK